jgi:hypothetical protein
MKKLAVFLMCLVSHLAPAAAEAACTYPQGSVGSSLNELGFITSLVPEVNGHQLRATYSYDDPALHGPPYSDVIAFGDGSPGVPLAEIAGVGWSGTKLTSYSSTAGTCTASVDDARDWRWALAAPVRPDALTIEALLYG